MNFPKNVYAHSKETLGNRKCRDTVWACAFEFNSKKSSLGLSQCPTEGLLAYTNNEHLEQEYAKKSDYEIRKPRYFVPKNAKGGYSWSKAVLTDSRAFADTHEACNALYETMVTNWIDWFKEGVALCKQYI